MREFRLEENLDEAQVPEFFQCRCSINKNNNDMERDGSKGQGSNSKCDQISQSSYREDYK